MGRNRVKLKKTIIAVLKENDEKPLSAEQLVNLCQAKGLHANYIPKSSNAMGQIMRQLNCPSCPAVTTADATLKGDLGNTYVSAVYSLESEEAFNRWLEKVSQ